MPNALTSTGLTIVTQAELLTKFQDGMKNIYGVDINLDPSDPDGQFIFLFIQAILDNAELIKSVYTSFDPDQAFGVTLDERIAINGIQRQAGTYTITPITVVVNQSCNLYGLDQTALSVFSVADNAGNQWQLISTEVISAAGTYVFQFRSKNPGAKLTIPNTITVPKTIVLGVVSVNNPTTYTSLGLDEESDAKVKIRRSKSVQLASQGYLDGLLAALENINGVSSAFIYENKTGATDIDGIPSHSIWVIVAGAAAASDIATAIYQKRNAGCGLFGAEALTITQVDGSHFIVNWDYVQTENLFIKFTATSLDGINPPNVAGIRSGLVSGFPMGVYEQVNINDLAIAVQLIDNNCLVTAAGFSTSAGGVFTNTLKPTAKNKQFSLSAANIIITPMIMSPSSASISILGTKQFTASGGYGAYTWTMDANPSGGSVSVSGLYTAGAVTAVDVVRATDTQGNFITATVNVV